MILHPFLQHLSDRVLLVLHCLIYETVVERLFDVSLFGFRVIDEFPRIRHRLLNDPKGGWESVFVVFEDAFCLFHHRYDLLSFWRRLKFLDFKLSLNIEPFRPALTRWED